MFIAWLLDQDGCAESWKPGNEGLVMPCAAIEAGSTLAEGTTGISLQHHLQLTVCSPHSHWSR